MRVESFRITNKNRIKQPMNKLLLRCLFILFANLIVEEASQKKIEKKGFVEEYKK